MRTLLLFKLTALVTAVSARGNKKLSKREPLRIVIPARAFCTHPTASIDFSLNSCVHVNRLVKTAPIFSECPSGTRLEGRKCMGHIETDFEDGCPFSYNLNSEGECIKADVYSPPEKVCPEGFHFHIDSNTNVRICLKRSFVDVLYSVTDPVEDNDCKMSDGIVPRDSCKLSALCPSGYKLVRNSKHQDRSYKHGKHTLRAVCSSEILVPPEPRQTCIKGYHWSRTVAGCIKCFRVTPTQQCPRPNAKIGLGRGDLETPEFRYDAGKKKCIAEWATAVHPQCLPGWALLGSSKPNCVKKVFTPIHYDCRNAEGFKFRWDETGTVGLCEYIVLADAFSAGASHLTRRSKINGHYLQLVNNPSNIIEGYATGLRAEHLKNEEKAFLTAQHDEEPLATTFISEPENLNLLKSLVQVPLTLDQPTQKKSSIEEISNIVSNLAPSEMSDDENNYQNIPEENWGTFETFHNSLPHTRNDLLKPRSPGSFKPEFSSPISNRDRLYNYATRKGLF